MHIRLALEPLNRFEMYLLNTLAEGVRFCRQTGLPNVGLLADTHHSNIEEENPALAWQAAAPFIFQVHISENHRGIPGRGHAIPREIFRTLKQSGYDDWLTIEAFTPKVKPLVPRLHVWREYFEREADVAVEGLRFIRQNWEQAG
jgi:D-psicose/D-tagatose/L-ribulose 3-epimerase